MSAFGPLRQIAFSWPTVALGCEADMAGPGAGSTRSLVTQRRLSHRLNINCQVPHSIGMKSRRGWVIDLAKLSRRGRLSRSGYTHYGPELTVDHGTIASLDP